MYSWKNLAQKSPNTISFVVMAVVNAVAAAVFVAIGHDPSTEFLVVVGSAETALQGTLSLFVIQPNTVTNQVAAEQVTTAKAEAEADMTKALVELDPKK